MEWLLLLFLSSIATGAIAYFLREEPKIIKEQEISKESKPIPSIPEVKQKVSLKIDKEDIQKFKEFVEGMPTPIQPEVHHTQDLKEEVHKIKKEILRKKKPLKVTYTTDEIIPRASPFSRHRRPLLNAEKFVEEQKAKEALTIYERLEKRIPDEEIKQKIRKNIEDIKNWLLGIEEEEPIEFPEIIIPLNTQVFAIEQFNEGLKKISEDIANEITKILKDNLSEKLDQSINKTKIHELSADKIYGNNIILKGGKDSEEIFETGSEEPKSVAKSDIGGIKEHIKNKTNESKFSEFANEVNYKERENKSLRSRNEDITANVKELKIEKVEGGIEIGGMGGGIGVGSLQNEMVSSKKLKSQTLGKEDIPSHEETQKEKIQTTQESSGSIYSEKKLEKAKDILTELKSEEEKQKNEKNDLKTNGFTTQLKEKYEDISKSVRQVIHNDYTNIYYQYFPKIPDSLTQKKEGIAKIDFIPVYAPIGPKVPTKMEEYWEGFTEKEGFQFDEEGNLITDGWTDKDFEKEWEKYKHLPLIDRRSGIDRRKDYNFDPTRPDRRKGEDRRKVNLFEEREQFLEKYKKHQERKKALQEKSKYLEKINQLKFLDFPPVIQITPYKEELEQIELPEPKIESFSKELEDLIKDKVEKELIVEEDGIKKEEEVSYPKINFPESISEEITGSFSKELGDLIKGKVEKELIVEEGGIKKEEEISFPKINFPESISKEEFTELLEIKFPESSLQEQEANFIPLEETKTISKVEIIEPKLQELFLPDPMLPEEIPSKNNFDKKEDKQSEMESSEEILPEEQKEESETQLEDQYLPTEKSSEKEKQQFGEGVEELDYPQIPDIPETKGPVQEIRGVLELKPPDEEDAPFLTLTYDFSKIPDSFQLSKNYHTLEYVYYKYKPLLIKAQEFARRKMIKNALNYYRMIKSQNIPPEFKRMINRNIQDITDYIEKFMMSRSE